MIFKEAMTKLKLPRENHPRPYKVVQLCKGNEVSIASRYSVKFSMVNNFEDEV